MAYVIHRKHYYYEGTFNVPRDRLLRDDFSDRIRTFETHEDAVAWIESHVGSPCGDNCWSSDGRYVERHGEYARPTYSIHQRK